MSISSKYTFLLPAYKAKFLDAAIQSILNQTYPYFQLVISDDCSPENLWSVVEKYTNDGRVTYRRNQVNMGQKDLVSHWDLLVDLCDSPYFILASDDDVYKPDFLTQIDACIKRFPNVALFRGRTSMIDAEGNILNGDFEYPEKQEQVEYCKSFLTDGAIICIGNCVFNTQRFKELGGFVDFPLAWKSDSATQFRMAEDGIVHTTNGSIYLYRASGVNISTVKRSKAIDRSKMEAVIKVSQWVDSICVEDDAANLKSIFKYRLQGECRSYYWQSSVRELIQSYRFFSLHKCFPSTVSKLSYIGHWLIEKIH